MANEKRAKITLSMEDLKASLDSFLVEPPKADRRGVLAAEATARDLARAEALAVYLADLHRAPVPGPPERYHRALRDLIGSGEGVLDIADSYPEGGPVPFERLAALERRCVDFRWKIRGLAHRLRRTHGDFHPYNILFREGVDFTLLDASRGGSGERSVKFQRGEVRQPHERRQVFGEHVVDHLALARDRDRLDPVRPVGGRVLLKEGRGINPVGPAPDR